MKRFFAFLIIIILSFTVLTACNYVTGTGPAETTAETTGALSTEETTAQGEVSSVSEEVIATQTVADTTAQTQENNSSKEQTLIETEEFAITVTDCVTDKEKGFTMNTYLVNKTETPIEFRVTASALNNKDMHPDFTQEVKAGESMTAPMIWSAEKLAERRVTEVTEVKIELQVVSYGENAKMLSSDIYTINP